MANAGNSDALLMSMHKERMRQHRNLLGSSQGGALPAGRGPDPLRIPLGRGPDPLTRSPRHVQQSTLPANNNSSHNVMEKLNRSKVLSRELDAQYGRDAQKVALSQYSQHTPQPGEPQLIEQILSQRNKEHSRRQDEQAQDLMKLNEMREKLMKEQEQFDRKKVVHERRTEYLEKTYNGDKGQHTYHQWQMEHYQSARGIVDDVTDKFLGKFFQSEPDAPSGTIARAEKMRASRAKVTQLLMEELILESTSELSRVVSREVRNSFAYVKNKTDMHFMQQAEAIAINDPRGRPDDDAAKNLITKGFQHRQRDRNKTRKDIWGHTQHQHVAKKTEDKDNEEESDDVEELRFHHIAPLDLRQYTTQPGESYDEQANKLNYLSYRNMLSVYWTRMVAEVSTISLAPRCLGVTATALSADHRFLAVGTQHGDLLIYDLLTVPPRPVKALCNMLKYDDPIDHISFSLDGRKLLTTNVTGGTVKAWTWQAPGPDNVAITKDDVSLLKLGPDSHGNLPEIMGNVLDLDLDRGDTKFQSGPFDDLQLHKSVYGPTLAVFYPTFTLLGTQNAMCIALDNGDILRCDVENSYQEHMTEEYLPGEGGAPITVSKEVPKVYKPKIAPQDGPSTIGQGVPAELFRAHSHPIIYLGFVENSRNMVSVDQKAFIYIWRYHKRYMSGYGYYDTHSKHRLITTEKMFEQLPTSTRQVIYSEKTKPGEKALSYTEQKAARDEAEKAIGALNLPDHPWHKQLMDGRTSFIYPPRGNVPLTGAQFHTILRNNKDKKLSAHATAVYKPHFLQATKLIGCKPSTDGKTLVFLLLFPAYPPKEAHLTVVIVDLLSMKLQDWKRDIVITSNAMYERILAEDIVSFDVSKSYGPTCSSYLLLNMAGELHGYSLVTGIRVLRSLNPGNLNTPFKGCNVGNANLKLPENCKVLSAGYRDKLYIIVYSNGLLDREKKVAHNQMYLITLRDQNTFREKFPLWTKFTKWPGHPAVPLTCQRVDPLPRPLDPVTVQAFPPEPASHPAAYARALLMDLVDDVMEAKAGRYTEGSIQAHEALDAARNYEELLEEVEDRRTPFDPEDQQYEDDNEQDI